MISVPPVILVVEDDPDIAQMLDTLLSLEGYAVVVTRTVADAIDQLQHQLPDLILSDVRLSHGNGWSVYQQLRVQPQGQAIPYIFLTAWPDDIERVPDPVLCIMAKPFQPATLFTCLRTLLRDPVRR